MGAIRVLIGDDDPDFRHALADLVASDPAFELVGAAQDAEATVELALELDPDVVLLDVKMPAGGGPWAARAIRTSCPRTRTLALTAYHDRATIVEMLRAGASGYLVKGSSVDEILGAIVRAVDGEPSLSTDAAATLVRDIAGQLETEERTAQAARDRVSVIRTLAAGQGLSVELQPIVRLASREVAGAEALARFAADPGAGPAGWFAEARRLGCGQELELAAAAKALAHLARLPAGQFLSVNVSPDTAVSPGLRALISQFEADRVVLEITESGAGEEGTGLRSGLEALRSLGVRLAVDDSSGGRATLRQILWLQPHFIKLDIWLTHGVESSPEGQALAGALIHFAGDIGAAVIAEGIETRGQMKALAALGVAYGQGYFLGPPGPPAAVWDRLEGPSPSE